MISKSKLRNRNHAMVALDQRLTSVFSDYYATTPTELKLPSCAGRNGLPNKSISFFKHHVSAPFASMLRRQQWAVVTVPPAVHEDEAFQSTLRTEAINKIDQFTKQSAGFHAFEAALVNFPVQLYDGFPILWDRAQIDRLNLLRDEPTPDGVGFIVDTITRLQAASNGRILESGQPIATHGTRI